MTIEQRMDQLDKRNKRLTVAKTIFVMNNAGFPIVSMSATDAGNGIFRTSSAKGKGLVELNSTEGGGGSVTTWWWHVPEELTSSAQQSSDSSVRLDSRNTGG